MSKQIIVVLDNPPLEQDPWAGEVFKRAKLAPGSNDEVGDAMSSDPATRDALLEHVGDSIIELERMAKYYRRAFEKLYASVPRMGLYGTAWLSYVPVDACVVDWSEVERRATAQGVDPADGDQFRQSSQLFVRARAKRHQADGRLLELTPDLTLTARVEQAVLYLKDLGLA